MKSNPTVYTEIREGHVNNVVPILLAEWNHNRFNRAVAESNPAETEENFDAELFPVSSVVESHRPRAGINKALAGTSFATATRHSEVPSARYYTASRDDIYKYWISPYEAVGNAISGAELSVIYAEEAIDPEDENEAVVGKTVSANKIFITFENTYSYPTNYTVYTKPTPGGAWSAVATSPAIAQDGRVELYYNGSSWGAAPNYDNVATLHGVRIVATTMSESGSRMSVIELGLALELDLTVDLESTSDSASMSESDFVTPMGVVNANSGEITLFNEHRKYSNDNPSSVLYGLLDRGVKFSLSYKYSGGDIQQFVLYSDVWTEQLSDTTVSLLDHASIFMEIKPQPVLYQDITVEEAIWRVCDSVGFNNYVVERSSESTTPIDIFWTTGDETVWEVIQDLCRGTQTAAYFDSYGRLRIRSRDVAFDTQASPVWTLRREKSGNELPDIIDLNSDSTYEANKVKITYQPTIFSKAKGNVIPFVPVWEPEDTVTLRAADLQADLLVGGQEVFIPKKDAAAWPWSSILQIEGEWISTEGKGYTYYDGGTRTYAVVKSLEEQKSLDEKSNDGVRHLNKYSGSLVVKERGLWNTKEKDHKVKRNAGWRETKLNRNTNSASTGNYNGINQKANDSIITIQQSENMNNQLMLMRGSTSDQGYYRLGTKMRFSKRANNYGGIVFNAGNTGGEGYYVEVKPVANRDGGDNLNELSFYSLKSDGSMKGFGGEEIKLSDDGKDSGGDKKQDAGVEAAVILNRWFELDVRFNPDNHNVQIWFNGKRALDATVPSGTWRHSWGGQFGLYVRGNTKADFEYVYAIQDDIENYDDEETFFDRITDGYYGEQAIRDYTYEIRRPGRKWRKKNNKRKQRYDQQFFDDFGPIVHEVREFDIKFETDDNVPVLESKLFHTNTSQAVCTEFFGDTSGATFIMANTSRFNAVLSGEDTLTAMGEESIEHKLFVYGRPVLQEDPKEIVKVDEWAIRRRGTIENDYQSRWVQNETAAENLGNWLTKNWSRSDSLVRATVFGNPLFEIGDVVAIDYEDMSPATHRYFVTEINTNFNSGIETNLVLKRVSQN